MLASCKKIIRPDSWPQLTTEPFLSLIIWSLVVDNTDFNEDKASKNKYLSFCLQNFY